MTPEPFAALTLTATMPDPAVVGFRLDRGRLDTDRLPGIANLGADDNDAWHASTPGRWSAARASLSYTAGSPNPGGGAVTLTGTKNVAGVAYLPTSTTSRYAGLAGQIVTVGVDVWEDAPQPASTGYTYLIAHDAAGAQLTTGAVVSSSVAVPVPAGWSRVVTSHVLPAGAASFRVVTCSETGAAPRPVGAVFKVDRLTVEVGPAATSGAYVSPNPAARYPIPITGPLTQLEFQRGCRPDPLSPHADLGSATLELHNAPDWPDLRPGVTVTAAGPGGLLFTMTVAANRATWSKDGRHEYRTVSLVDAVARLTKARLSKLFTSTDVPVFREVADPLGTRVAKVAAAAGVAVGTVTTAPPIPGDIGGTLEATGAAEVLDLSAGAVGVRWWVGVDNRLNVQPAGASTGPALALSDTATGASYVGLDVDDDADVIVNALALETVAVLTTDKGLVLSEAKQAPAATVVVEDLGSQALYGRQAGELTVFRTDDPPPGAVAGSTPAEVVAGYWFGFTVRDSLPRPVAVTLLNPPALADFQQLDLTYRGTTYRVVAVARHDTITPHRWQTTLTLTNRRD